jgi:uncharacterized protein (DUF1015 family)
MADVRPFPGFRYDPSRAPLGKVLCPPYDAISPEQAKTLRASASNAIHMELPEGEGQAKYDGSAAIWKNWRGSGLLKRDGAPALYLTEETFVSGGKTRKRTGFLAALGATPTASEHIVCHERTLSKPKEDRLNLLRAVRANISPIFGIFPDPQGTVRKILAKAAKTKPVNAGKTQGGVAYRLWLIEGKDADAVRRALAARKILIADGHHRFSVSQTFYQQEPSPVNETLLAYLCPEEDRGLVVLPTHRIVARKVELADCRLTPCASRAAMLKKLSASKNPYAFGVFDGKFALAEPKSPKGCKSGLCVEYLSKNILEGVDPSDLRYTPDAALAHKWAVPGHTALFVKPMEVAQIRKAVAAVGLLPQKSTYFFPKIATGLVFKALE